MDAIIPRYADIGKAEAENDDEYFADCFVDTGLIDRLLSPDSSVSVIVGRTGSGKSALIRRIGETREGVICLNPELLSLGYLADSWLLRFLTDNDFDLSLFYQQLWRHVLVVELLKYHEDLRTSTKTKLFLSNIRSLFRNNAGKAEAIDYLERYGGSFWSDTDERIKRITDDFEEQVATEYGASFKTLSGKYKKGEKIGRHETKELVSTAQKIVGSVQMQKLARMIDILDEDIFTDRMKPAILLIDDLDRQWTDDRVRFKLIEALLNAIPKFRKVRNVKVLIAMRDDLMDRVLNQACTSGFQRDKFQDYHQRLVWKKSELRELVDKRVCKLFKKKYTNQNVELEDLFADTKREADLFDYISDRTMLRPRDYLAYFNMIFDYCGGKSSITLKDIRSVEFDYSSSRRRALVDEWREGMPFIDDLIGILAHRKMSAQFRLGAVDQVVIDQAATDLYAKNERSDHPLVTYARAHFDDHSEHSRKAFLFKAFGTLYLIGAVGLRTQENSRPQFAFFSRSFISQEELSDNTWCIVHPMLWQALGRRGELSNLFSAH